MTRDSGSGHNWEVMFLAITIANKTFSQHSLIHETIRIKSGAWDDAGVFIFSTLNHVKYCLSQGCVSIFPVVLVG
jgi:hypothetical protein